MFGFLLSLARKGLFFFVMLNMIQPGNVLPVILAATVLSSGVVVVGSMVGVAATSGVAGDTVSVAFTGVFAVNKTAGSGITQGTRLYWDAAANSGVGAVTTSAGSLPVIGYAAAAAASADTSVNVRLMPA